jgi:NADH-quinone oxidoreductase subunit E
LGIWTYSQIAEWTPENAAWVEEHLSFKGRVEREEWVEQAKALVDSAIE